MDWVTANLFFLILLLLCVGMHFFGHGHGGHSHRRNEVEKKNNDAGDHSRHAH